ncbi:MAG: ABC transporter permease [Deltaproteobacteria bacterium]|nr:ABC transporter permease [Deltaproteobacteria bacterium]
MALKDKIINRVLSQRDALYPLGAALGLIVLWQVTVYVLSIPEYLLPGPILVIAEISKEWHLLYQNALVTLYETGVGFAIAVIVSIPISVAVVWWRPVEKTVMPLMVFLQTIPKVAIAPLFIIWFGFGSFPKILISFLLAYFPIVIELITGLRDIEEDVLDLAKSMSSSSLQTFMKIRIPNSLPYMFSGLKLGALLALVGAVIGEFLGSMTGLGYLVIYANDRLDTTLLFADLVVLLLLGKVLFSVVEWAERYAISWHVVMREKEEVMFST